MTTETLVLGKKRFEVLFQNYDHSKIKELSTVKDENDKEAEFVTFEITVSNAFDILHLFHAGVSYGLNKMR